MSKEDRQPITQKRTKDIPDTRRFATFLGRFCRFVFDAKTAADGVTVRLRRADGTFKRAPTVGGATTAWRARFVIGQTLCCRATARQRADVVAFVTHRVVDARRRLAREQIDQRLTDDVGALCDTTARRVALTIRVDAVALTFATSPASDFVVTRKCRATWLIGIDDAHFGNGVSRGDRLQRNALIRQNALFARASRQRRFGRIRARALARRRRTGAVAVAKARRRRIVTLANIFVPAGNERRAIDSGARAHILIQLAQLVESVDGIDIVKLLTNACFHTLD